MNRKIFFSILVFFIAILSLGVTAAVDLQSNGNNSASIAGIDFNIPEDFSENKSLRIENETKSIGSISYVLNSQAYENANDFVTIFVSNYNNLEASDNIVNHMGDETVYINGEKGYLHEGNSFYSFTFEKEGKIISLSSNNKDIFKDFVT